MVESKIDVVVIYGGRSAEHEVSCRSAAFVFKNLNPAKYRVHALAVDHDGRWLPQDVDRLIKSKQGPLPIDRGQSGASAEVSASDPASGLLRFTGAAKGQVSKDRVVVFPVIHGTNGEDGTLQGMLEMADVAYVGSDTLGSAIGMDKAVSKRLAQAAGIPVVPWLEIRAQFWERDGAAVCDQALARFGLPIFVKPARLGSSVGITKVKNRDQLLAACRNAFAFDEKILLEQGMDVREIECAILGDLAPSVSVPGEVIPHAEFYTYDAKYIDAEGASLAVPAKLTPEQVSAAQEMSLKVYAALELYGMARIDLFLEKSTGRFYLNEVNTIPGFTEISQYPMLWQASGVPPAELLDRLISLAMSRQQQKRALKRSK